jgi:hypothetical protein
METMPIFPQLERVLWFHEQSKTGCFPFELPCLPAGQQEILILESIETSNLVDVIE